VPAHEVADEHNLSISEALIFQYRGKLVCEEV